MKNSTILLLSLLMLSSCTTMIFVNKSLPPEIEIPDKDQKIVIQNFFDYTRPEFVKEKHEEVFHSGISSFTNGLISFLAGSDLISAYEGDTLVVSGPERNLSDVLDPVYVEATCKRYQTDLLLAIDSLSIDFDWETETVENDDGSKEKTKYFYLLLQPFLSLYDNTGKLIDRSSIPDQEVYSTRPALSGLLTIRPSLKSQKAKREVASLADKASRHYGMKFFQGMASFPYKVYYTKPLNTAYRMMQTGNWAEAIRELLPFASSPDPKTAKRAAHNLGVAYTSLGDEASAKKWFEQAK